jgi:thiamine transport system permease protein
MDKRMARSFLILKIAAFLGLIGFGILGPVWFHFSNLDQDSPISIGSVFSQFKEPSAYFVKIFKFTLFQSFASSAISLLLGLILLLASKMSAHGWLPKLVFYIANFAYSVPTLFTCFAFISVFGHNGLWVPLLTKVAPDVTLLYSAAGILLIHIMIHICFVGKKLIETSQDFYIKHQLTLDVLDLTFTAKFLKIELRYLAPILMKLFILVFINCFFSFGPIFLIGGHPRFNSLEVAILSSLQDIHHPNESLFLILVQGLCLALLYAALYWNQKGVLLSGNPSRLPDRNTPHPAKHHSLPLRLLWTGGGLCLCLFVVIPFMGLIGEGFMALKLHQVRHFWQSWKNWESFLSALWFSMGSSMICGILVSLFVYIHQSFLGTLAKKSRLGTQIFSLFLLILMIISPVAIAVGYNHIFIYLSAPVNLQWITTGLVQGVVFAIPVAFTFKEILEPFFLKCAQFKNQVSVSKWLFLGKVERPYLLSKFPEIFSLAFLLALGDLAIVSSLKLNDSKTLTQYLVGLMSSYKHQESYLVISIMIILFFCFQMKPKKWAST